MADQPNEKRITLDTPIQRGGNDITELVLHKPQSGALRGTRLQAIIDLDVNALMTLIPRIATPALTTQEVTALDPADLMVIAIEVATFLLPKSVIADLPTT
ncbi:phage tail assembly protein [Edwardsiella tarda]|uniref:phage tail assembly protein n=1 Tax=Edwardsiella tarda TaxID=636 RepID=UPI00351BED6B